MTSKASNQRDITDVIKKQKRDNKKAAGIARAQASGISGSDTAIASGQKTQAGSAGASNVTQDLLMNTFDIRDVDRLYFSTTAGSADVLTENDTGIESKSYYNGTSYVSVGMSQRVPANNVFTFAIGATERFNIGTSISALNSNLGLSGYLDIGANYIQVDETTPTLVGTVPADERRIFSDSTNNSELSVKKSDGSVISLEGAGGGANQSLSNLTDPTAINQDLNMQGNSLVLDADKDTYIESTTDDTLIMQVGGSSAITINNTSILTAKPISVLIGSVNMNTNPINFQNTGQSISSTSGGIIHSVPTSDTHGFAVDGDLKLSISGSATTLTDNLVMNTNDITSIQSLEFSSNLSTPSTNGTIYAQDISGVRRVFVRTGGATKDLTDIGTGSGGASLSGNNTWTGTNSFNGAYVTVAGLFSATGTAFTIGNASSDQLYINSTMQSDLDMGDNKITDLATPTSNYDAATKKYVDDNAGGGGVSLSGNNTWTGTNNFNGSYVTVTGTFSATGAAISLGNHSSDIVNIGGTLGGTLRMGDNDIDDIDNLNVDGTANLNNIVNLGSGSSDDINLKGKLDVINHTTSSTVYFSNIISTGYIEIKVGNSTKRLYYGNG